MPLSTKLLRFAPLLRAYFYSGWAFFIPYLAAYLLYAWLEWPVNPAGTVASSAVDNDPSSAFSPLSSAVPSLLYVYWALHAIHLVLAAVAFSSWWHDQKTSLTVRQSSALHHPSSVAGSAPSAFSLQLSALWPVVPWLLLAAIFAIPGIYLEWPSDPWEHLRRINEWHAHSTVLQHSWWYRSSYYLSYGLTGFATGLAQLTWLNVYYTSVFLVLSWQYYRLARAVGLDRRLAFLFVLLNAITFGNSVFSFYRYYGVSSSIFAQLGAVALTRTVFEALQHPQFSLHSFLRLPFWPQGRKKRSTGAQSESPTVSQLSSNLPAHGPANDGLPSPNSDLRAPVAYCLLPTGFLLLLLTAFNHIQGVGIAGLGILTVVVWRLIEWKRSMIGWLALAALLLSVVTILWFPRHPALDAAYRPQGWLTAWYGFNLFSASSPAFDRTLQTLGAFGVINLVPGLWLAFRKNHIAGWLTVMPVLALALPCFALPLAHVLASQTRLENIITFQRFLFAVPVGLALVAVIPYWAQSAARNETRATNNPKLSVRSYSRLAPRYSFLVPPFAPCSLMLALLTLLPAGKSSYNRFWHCMQITPDDLQLKSYLAAWTQDNLALAQKDTTLVVTTPLSAKVQEIFSPSRDWSRRRLIQVPFATAKLERHLDRLRTALLGSDWKQASTEVKSAESPPDWLLLSRGNSTLHKTHLITNLTASNAPWLRFGRQLPQQKFVNGRLTISNPLGAACQMLSPDLIPINHSKRYQLTSTIRQTGDPTATNYLAVAWYDRTGRLLRSNLPAPDGAGAPAGWSSNGDLSYYGLINLPAPAKWASYTVAFGLGESAAIPANATFLRAGALLNYNGTPDTVIQLTDVVLWEKPPYTHLLVIAPMLSGGHMPASLAARLSGHWSPQKVFVDQAGTEELRAGLPAMASEELPRQGRIRSSP